MVGPLTGLHLTYAEGTIPGASGSGQNLANDYFAFVNGPFTIQLTYQKTTSYRSGCDPGANTQVVQSSNLNGIYLIYMKTHKYNYAGIDNHCLSFCGTGVRYYNLQTGSESSIINDQYLYTQPDIQVYGSALSSFGDRDETTSTIKFNFGIYHNTSTNKFYVDFLHINGAPVQRTAYTANINKPSFTIKLYHNGVYKTNKTIAFNTEYSYYADYGDGHYKIEIESNKTIATMTINLGSCTYPYSGENKTYSFKTSASVIYEYDISGSNITNKNLTAPTSLDYIYPKYTGSGMMGPEDTTLPDIPEAPTPEEGESEQNFLQRALSWFLSALFDCDEMSLQYFTNSWNYLLSKFPFRIFNDIKYILSGIGAACPIYYIYGPSGTPTGIWSPCQVIPSSIISTIKILFNLSFTITIIFGIYKMVKSFFMNTEE